MSILPAIFVPQYEGNFLSVVFRSINTQGPYLRKLPGVGPKTAACVLMFHLDKPAFPIDTHVHRTSRRLGLIGANVSADKAHELFAKVLPAEWVYPLHVNLIRHGRQICHAQRPACSRCALYRECAFVESVNPQETTLSASSSTTKQNSS